MKVKERIEQVWPQLHAMPEPAFREVKTSALLAAALKKAGYQVREQVGAAEFPLLGNVAGSPMYSLTSPTGVVAVLDSGKPGPVVGLRSDMDCLMFTQPDGSEQGIHACGHDGHMSMVLAAAERLAQEGIARGKVKIIFQPAEEIGMGALSLIADGAIEDVDYLFGIHLMSKAMAKSGQAIPSVKWTACTLMTATLEGLAAHGSKPHLGINTIDAGAAIVNAINALHTNPLLGGNVKTTRFQAGSSSLNSICPKAELGFDLRSTDNEEMEQLRQQVADLVTKTAAVYGATASTKIIGTCPASQFDEAMVEIAKTAIVAELGAEGLLEPKATTVGEDFNFYPLLRPGLKTGFIGLGCDLEPGLHDPKMHFNRADLVHGCNILYNMVQAALRL